MLRYSDARSSDSVIRFYFEPAQLEDPHLYLGGGAGFDDRPVEHVQVVGGGHPLGFGGDVQTYPHPLY